MSSLLERLADCPTGGWLTLNDDPEPESCAGAALGGCGTPPRESTGNVERLTVPNWLVKVIDPLTPCCCCPKDGKRSAHELDSFPHNSCGQLPRES